MRTKSRQNYLNTACKFLLFTACLSLRGLLRSERLLIYTCALSRQRCHEAECFGVILRSKQFPFVIDRRKHVNHKLPSKKPDPATSTFLLNVCNRDFCTGCIYYELQVGAYTKVKGLTSAWIQIKYLPVVVLMLRNETEIWMHRLICQQRILSRQLHNIFLM